MNSSERSERVRDIDLSGPMLPVPRSSMAMHNGDNENVIRFNGVKNGVREDAGQIPAYMLFKNSSLIGIFNYVLNGLFDSRYVTISETGLAVLVIEGSLLVFFKCIRMKTKSHFLMDCLTCARATSPGMV